VLIALFVWIKPQGGGIPARLVSNCRHWLINERTQTLIYIFLIQIDQLQAPPELRVNFERLQIIDKWVFRVLVRLALTGTPCTSW